MLVSVSGCATGDLDELTLTTNGSQLAKMPPMLKARGVHRINCRSIRLMPTNYTPSRARRSSIRCWPDRRGAGRRLKIKIDTVALRDVDGSSMIGFGHGRGMDLTLIEVMPLAESAKAVLERCRCPWSRLAERFTLEHRLHTQRPARRARRRNRRLGFITMTHNFCGSSNRVRHLRGLLYAQDRRRRQSARPAARLGERRSCRRHRRSHRRAAQGHDFIIDRRHQRPALSQP